MGGFGGGSGAPLEIFNIEVASQELISYQPPVQYNYQSFTPADILVDNLIPNIVH